MRLIQLFLALLISALSVWIEFRPIKEFSLFTDWIYVIPFGVLCVSVVVFLVVNLRQFIPHKQIISFTPLLICLVAVTIILFHKARIAQLDNSPSTFTASTFDIGSDGGFVLDFKANGHLKAEKRDHWSVKYYWGEYAVKNDTFDLNIPLDFKLSKRAFLMHDSLFFEGDTAKFSVYRH